MKWISLALLLLSCVLFAGCVSRTAGLFSNRVNSSYVLCAAAELPRDADKPESLKENDLAITQPCNPGI